MAHMLRGIVSAFFVSLLLLPFGLAAHAAPGLLPASERADRVVIEKAARTLILMRGETVIATYPVRLGFAPEGQKTRQGDGKTPEGEYRINRRNAGSAFHLSLGINYPLPAQRKAARARGENPGGDIFIHGQPNKLGDWADLVGGLPFDWTEGCIAVSNENIRHIWQRVARGTPVTIKP
jgi:murein L,D-transpeptidase YafK